MQWNDIEIKLNKMDYQYFYLSFSWLDVTSEMTNSVAFSKLKMDLDQQLGPDSI